MSRAGVFSGIHLGTLLLIALLAAGILYLNLCPTIVDDPTFGGLNWDYFRVEVRGWPWCCYTHEQYALSLDPSERWGITRNETIWSPRFLAQNAVMSLSMLIMLALAAEWLIRRTHRHNR